jgi:hypothetical protein
MWELMLQFIGTIVGVIVGGLITWLVSRYFYKRAGDELRIEADRIRKLSNLICRALEQAELAEFKSDKDGGISSLYVNLKAVGGGKSGGSATLTVDKKADDSKTPG